MIPTTNVRLQFLKILGTTTLPTTLLKAMHDLPIQPHDSSENRNAANSNYSNFSSSARINNREQNHRSQNPDV